MQQHPELTIIVAATRSMGIGAHGTLPWHGLRREMAYFARVTKRVPAATGTGTAAPPPHALNAVIMGRATWASIPSRFRPLADRINVVLTSRPLDDAHPQPPSSASSSNATPPPIAASSLADALAKLSALTQPPVARVFVIGGASVYAAALTAASTMATRVLLTRVEGEFECDTFFPLELVDDDGDGEGKNGGWTRSSKEELDAWTGETVPEGRQVENGVEYEFQMWEKR